MNLNVDEKSNETFKFLTPFHKFLKYVTEILSVKS